MESLLAGLKTSKARGMGGWICVHSSQGEQKDASRTHYVNLSVLSRNESTIQSGESLRHLEKDFALSLWGATQTGSSQRPELFFRAINVVPSYVALTCVQA